MQKSWVFYSLDTGTTHGVVIKCRLQEPPTPTPGLTPTQSPPTPPTLLQLRLPPDPLTQDGCCHLLLKREKPGEDSRCPQVLSPSPRPTDSTSCKQQACSWVRPVVTALVLATARVSPLGSLPHFCPLIFEWLQKELPPMQ